ncbi:hypothetical protein SLEP1_g58132 [Rubroshorea leprosula]|uniref:Uncharacterized protein n=1 Tax=Rubroshorea leprosula TaxID=152421 RepID=A0AAV5MNG0_9ROSI|nr:hypothetical protein SLEP1_g58132 [Rubroshorea leprosula]
MISSEPCAFVGPSHQCTASVAPQIWVLGRDREYEPWIVKFLAFKHPLVNRSPYHVIVEKQHQREASGRGRWSSEERWKGRDLLLLLENRIWTRAVDLEEFEVGDT